MITHEEYYCRLQKYALGWLDWDYERAMKSDVNAIDIAMEGKIEMLKAIHFPEKPKGKRLPLSREALLDKGKKKGLR